MQLVTYRDIGYTVCRKFEETIRLFLTEELKRLSVRTPDILSVEQKDKAARRSRTALEEATDLTLLECLDLIELKEIVYKSKTSAFTRDGRTQAHFEQLFNSIYDLRCKVAHYRDTFGRFELTSLINSCIEILPADEVTDSLKQELHGYLNQSLREILKTPNHYKIERETGKLVGIRNNLPIPDYADDGGFVGRSELIKEICNFMRKNRIVTLAGSGGVGKTALALECVKRILEIDIVHFDAVVWCSAKETRLSHLGIEELEPDVKSLSDLLAKIHHVLGTGDHRDIPNNESTELLSKVLETGTKLLLVLDNLETITDAELIDFLLDAPDSISILITSRKGLGQVERRVEVKALPPKDAATLFRVIAKNKGLDDLAALEEDIVRSYAAALSNYPLIIKWAIGHVACGRDINYLLSEIASAEGDIAAFCFDYIYRGLTENSKKTLAAICLSDGNVPAGLLKYITNLDELGFSDAIAELLLVSLVTIENYKDSENNIARRFGVLTLTRSYVRNVIKSEGALRLELEGRMKVAQADIIRAEDAKSAVRFTLWSAGARTEEEKISAAICNSAIQKSQAGQHDEAVILFKKAAEIAPRFPNVFRSWAITEAQLGHGTDADTLIKKAIDLNPRDPNTWLTYGNIKRKAGHTRDAIRHYEQALKLNPTDRVALSSLGQACIYNDEFERGIALIQSSLRPAEHASEAEDYHKKINYTAIAGAYITWASHLLKSKQKQDAFHKTQLALDAVTQSEKYGAADDVTLSHKGHILYRMGQFLAESDTISAINHLSQALDIQPRKYQHAVNFAKASLLLAKVYWMSECTKEAAEVLSSKTFKRIRLQREDYEFKLQQESLLQLFNNATPIHYGYIDRIGENFNYLIIKAGNETVLVASKCFLIPIDYERDAVLGLKVYFTYQDNCDREVGDRRQKRAEFAWL